MRASAIELVQHETVYILAASGYTALYDDSAGSRFVCVTLAVVFHCSFE